MGTVFLIMVAALLMYVMVGPPNFRMLTPPHLRPPKPNPLPHRDVGADLSVCPCCGCREAGWALPPVTPPHEDKP
jgi:hypothetical protein